MAQSGRKKPPQGGSRNKATSGARYKGGKSVAAARKSGGNRTQFLIGGAAVVVIAAIVIVGVITTANKTAVQGSGYGVSTETTASVTSPGVITVSNGSPDLKLDIFEDALCPACAQLEHQYGEQIAKAMDDGKLIVNYRMVNFLDAGSKSGTYSSRAFGALLAVAQGDGDEPGVFMRFHTALYDPDNQPKELGAGGTSDLSNKQLADLAGKAGASESTQRKIADGAEVDTAKTDAQKNLAAMEDASKKGGFSSSGTPTVALNGVRIATTDTSWLTNLLAQSGASGDETVPATGSAAGSENQSPVTGTENQSPVQTQALDSESAGTDSGAADSTAGSSATK